MQTINSRLQRAENLLTLIVAACREPDENQPLLEGQDIVRSVLAVANEALNEVQMLQALPEVVISLPAPTDDDLGPGDPKTKFETLITKELAAAIGGAQ